MASRRSRKRRQGFQVRLIHTEVGSGPCNPHRTAAAMTAPGARPTASRVAVVYTACNPHQRVLVGHAAERNVVKAWRSLSQSA